MSRRFTGPKGCLMRIRRSGNGRSAPSTGANDRRAAGWGMNDRRAATFPGELRASALDAAPHRRAIRNRPRQAALGSGGHEKAPVTASPGLGLVGVRGLTSLRSVFPGGGATYTSPGRCFASSGFFTPTLAQAALGSGGHEKAPVTASPGLGLVGVRGFEPPTSSSRTTRANRAALHPEQGSLQHGMRPARGRKYRRDNGPYASNL